MRYKIIDQRQQRIDKEVEKERRKFVYGTYIISTINVLLTLIVAFYLVKNDQFVDNAVKYTVIIFFPYLLSLYFTKKIYNKKLVTIVVNLYYIFGMLVSDILFGMTLGNFFHFIIEAGNGRQIIPAILVTMLTYVYSIFSNISGFLKRNKKTVVWGMVDIYVCQLFIVKGKVLTIIVDIIAVIFSLLELKINVKEVSNKFDYLTNNGKRREINLLPFMIQEAIGLYLEMLVAIEEILKLGLDSNDD